WDSPELSKYWSNTILSVICERVPEGSSDQAGWPPRASAHWRISSAVLRMRDMTRSKANGPDDRAIRIAGNGGSVERFALDEFVVGFAVLGNTQSELLPVEFGEPGRP